MLDPPFPLAAYTVSRLLLFVPFSLQLVTGGRTGGREHSASEKNNLLLSPHITDKPGGGRFPLPLLLHQEIFFPDATTTTSILPLSLHGSDIRSIRRYTFVAFLFLLLLPPYFNYAFFCSRKTQKIQTNFQMHCE
jgi:hypothetical protein